MASFPFRPLESLGPMVGKIFIQAKDDSYEKTRQSMEKAKRKNAMNCVKELKSSSSFGGRLRPAIGSSKKSSTLVVPPPKKEVTAELPSNNRYNHNHNHNQNQNHSHNTSSSNSPHRTAPSVAAASASAAASATASTAARNPPPPPPPSNPNGRKANPDLVRRPLKERLIHLLAVRNYKKLELVSKLYSDGIKEKDKRQMSGVLNSVAQIKDNIYHLSRHLWAEVREDWPFYTDAEKQAVKKNKPQSLTPPGSNSGHSPTPALPLSPSPGSQGLKRPHEEVFDPTAKRPRWNATKSTKRKIEDKLESQPASRLEPQNDVRGDTKSDSRSVSNGRHHMAKDESPRINGKISPAATSASKPSSITTTSPVRQGSPRHRHNGINTHQSSGNHSPINGISNGLTNGHGNPPHRTNGHARVESSVPSSSPDTHQGGEEGDPEYLRTYTAIVSSDQRSQYKADFNEQYQEYLRLHSYIEERTRPFSDLDERLKNETIGSEEYNVSS
ncbi:RNA polymerase II elongation factor ELL-like [Penaeus japonicus]|uniref:RNA polymerase II elongation factor ELL-like n=1 Tax=Penaeus japonicus TaxID=27405 RepID=UPI001C717AB3|nr:RNA polymerase II elongation factor ELL-like [Penaeus japonicus]